MTEKLSDLLPELGIIRAIVSEDRLKEFEAADHLEAELDRLREALKDIAALDPLTQGDIAVRRAAKALRG